MRNLFPTTPNVTPLNVESNKVLIFSPLTKSMCEELNLELKHYLTFPKQSTKRTIIDDELEKHHGFKFSDIVAIGDTKLETRLANSYIAQETITINDIKRRNYKCFVNKDWRNPTNKMNLPYHDDGGCAWNCLMLKLKNPEYGIIFTISTTNDKMIKKFKLNLDE